mgnify:CR=1 FL=1
MQSRFKEGFKEVPLRFLPAVEMTSDIDLIVYGSPILYLINLINPPISLSYTPLPLGLTKGAGEGRVSRSET